jgi:hypothetical protein
MGIGKTRSRSQPRTFSRKIPRHLSGTSRKIWLRFLETTRKMQKRQKSPKRPRKPLDTFLAKTRLKGKREGSEAPELR